MCDPDRSAYVPVAGEQARSGSVGSPEKTGFCLQTLPQVLPAIKLSSLPKVKSNKKLREGATVRFDSFPTELRDFYGDSVVQTSR